MKQNKKKKSAGIRWRLFAAILVPTFVVLIVLWVLHTVLLGMFYSGIRTSELKKTTENVINNLERDDINDRILMLSNDGDINIRVIETERFNTLYTTGEPFNSVTYGWEVFGMFNLYDDVCDAGGELVRYYSEKSESFVSSQIPSRTGKQGSKEHSFPDVPKTARK